jgi:multidrug efflux pump subunit AcrB
VDGRDLPATQGRIGRNADLRAGVRVVFVFLSLAAQYESWSMPFMVLLLVPSALFGASGHWGAASICTPGMDS